MDISSVHIASKRIIGKSGSADVHELVTKGGLYLVVKREGAKSTILGTGPHRAIARHIAEKNEPKMLITTLSKSDQLDVRAMASHLPRWIEFTNQLRARG